jgi:transposase, IS5 family
LDLTRKVVRQAAETVERWQDRKLPIIGNLIAVEMQTSELRKILPLVNKVMAQTKERLWGGNTHVADKVLSLFEAHTQVIRKGKAHKPNEFGRLVRIDEVENGIVSGYEILEGNAADTNSWLPAIQHHIALFGEPPHMGAADRGFFSAENEREAEAWGVAKVALPARGRLSKKRAERQKERWFKRAMRWRAGSERTISHLKNPFSMKRATYKGDHGFKRYVGWSVITKNLFSIARWQELKQRR